MSSRFGLSILFLIALAMTCSASCSRSSATPCTFNEDCAEPYEYCSAQTDLCTPYECIEDSACKMTERCSPITNTCIPRPRPDMSMPEDMTPVDMPPSPPDMPADIPVPVEDLGPPDLGPPDLGPPEEMGPPPDQTRPEVVSVTPASGASVALDDDTPDVFVVTFNEAIDPVSISPFSVELVDEEGTSVELDLSYDETSNQLTITTLGTLPFAPRPYRLTLDSVIRDPAYNTLERDLTSLYYPPLEPDNADHALAAKWSPVLHQEIADVAPGAWPHDVPSRVDFDGDWSAANNLENLPAILPEQYTASMYYHVVSTSSHHFITYMLYYPSRVELDAMSVETRHEHDFTGVMLVVERASDELLLVEGLRVQDRTDLIIAFVNQARGVDLPGQGRIKGSFEAADLVDGTHYPLYVPAKRHEACNWDDPEVLPLFDVCRHPARGFRSGFSGAIMTHAEQGQSFTQAVQQAPDAPLTMSYALLPFEETFWLRRDFIGASALFGRGFSYSPEDGRPAGPTPDVSLYLPQSLASEDPDSYGKSPYQWLTQPARRNDGQWLIDPSWTVRQRYRVPTEPEWSYDYCYNIPLAIDRRAEQACMDAPPTP